MKRKVQHRNIESSNPQPTEDFTPADIMAATEVTGVASAPPISPGAIEGYRTLFPISQLVAQSAEATGGNGGNKSSSLEDSDAEKRK